MLDAQPTSKSGGINPSTSDVKSAKKNKSGNNSNIGQTNQNNNGQNSNQSLKKGNYSWNTHHLMKLWMNTFAK